MGRMRRLYHQVRNLEPGGTQTAPGFSLYGQELLQRYVPTYSGGGIGGFEGKNIQIGQ